MKPQPLLLIALIALTAACNPGNKKSELPDPLLTNRDTTIAPSDNFFLYANGGWFTRNPIPASERSNGIYRLINDTINMQVRKVCERSATANAEKGSNKQKIGDFYATGMDTVTIEALGIFPLNEELERIDAITDVKSMMTVIGHLQTFSAPVFAFYVGQDDKISTKYALFFRQGGLGLGDRDYYFNTDSRTVNIRKEYLNHVQAMLGKLGMDDATASKNAVAVMKIETELAKASRKLEALRDPVRNYNKMTVSQFNKMTPAIDWRDVISNAGIASADTVIIGQPEFFQSLNVLVKKYPAGDWKAYLKWNLIKDYADYLSSDIVAQHFKFYSTVLSGVTEQQPRWKRVVHETNGFLGELIGQVYVDEYLPKGSKEKLLEIGNSVRDVFADHIRALDWMSEATKAKAMDKLGKIVMKVGYPDKWKDMSALELGRDSYCKNALRANAWFFNYSVLKLDKPVDRSEWQMYPQTYNAYYDATNNEIVVPACNILVPGFEGRLPDDAILYGIIGGSTFGHEITHGFDDQGSQYDANGNLSDWWTKEDRDKFVAKTKRIVNQFSGYVVLDSLHINGDATQGENIADLGGVVVGYEAFKKTPQYKNNVIIGGLTPDQRYFLAYSYAWLVNMKNESLARQIMTDVHAPAEFRVNGPLSNVPEFRKTFGIKEGDRMFRADSARVVIW